MSLTEIPEGSRVLLDANILLYGIRRASLQSFKLLQRCEAGSLYGTITTVILAEIQHRRMIEEAQLQGFVSSNPARGLSGKPEIIRQLVDYADEIRALLGGGLTIETVQPEDFFVALELQIQFGLMTNDSLNLALAKRKGIPLIATADRGFDSVKGFKIYRPTDLKSRKD